jgi:hypothetical protein
MVAEHRGRIVKNTSDGSQWTLCWRERWIRTIGPPKAPGDLVLSALVHADFSTGADKPT